MIVYPSSLSAIAAAAGRPLTHPRILWQNRGLGLTAASVAVSSEAAGGPRDAPLRPDTFEYWEPTAIPATWEIDLGAEYLIDAVGVAAHTLGSLGLAALISAGVEGDIDTDESLPSFSAAGVQADDSPILFLDDLRSARYVRLTITRRNLLLYSEQIDNAAWGDIATPVVTANTTVAPDGTLTADTIEDNDGADYEGISQSVTIPDDANPHTFSVYVKKTASATNTFGVNFNLTGGSTVTTQPRLNTNSGVGNGLGTVTDEGDYWRLSATLTNNDSGNTTATVSMFGATSTNSGSDPGIDSTAAVGSAVVWGAMLNQGSEAAEYAKTTDGVVSTMPRVASIYIGEALAMERPLYAGHGPITLSRETAFYQALSRGGQFLGQSFRRHGLVGSASFSNLSAAWVRSELDPFIASARGLPYFFAWRPSSFPAELAYVWTREDIRPSNLGRRDLMSVSWSMVGHSDV